MLWPSFRVGSAKLDGRRKTRGFSGDWVFFFFFSFFLSRVVTVIFDVDCARGSTSVIYIDMCEMFVNRYAYDML